jgi:hypothetical protein
VNQATQEIHRHHWRAIDAALNRYRCECGVTGYRVAGGKFKVLREGAR